MKSHTQKRSRRRPRKNESASQNDTVHLKGSDIISNVSYVAPGTGPLLVGSASSFSLDLRPNVMSDRVRVEATIFSRWRINWLKVTYKSIAPSSVYGALALGILDDALTFDANQTLDTFDEIVNLRRSNDNNVWKSFSLVWKPVDPKKWYYTDNNPSGDLRFSSPATLFAAFATPFTNYVANVLGSIRLDYSVSFTGATPSISVTKLIKLIPDRVRADEEIVQSSSNSTDKKQISRCHCDH